jgi:twitching motility protein PilT
MIEEDPMARIDELLQLGRERGCSDVHVAVGRSPLLRVDGELSPVESLALTADETRSMLTEILDETQNERLAQRGAVDLSYESATAGRFRLNICRSLAGLSAVFRVIPEQVVPLAQLGLPRVTATIAELSSGLVLVTGAASTGKSTTLAALVDEINRTRDVSILTLEDPIEFLHESKKALIVQRALGDHVPSFAEGLRSALRQDPDVILVGDLRDAETVSLALEATETGHLVLATMHTRGAAETIDRILDAFPAEAHRQVCNTLADNLKCVVSQELVRAADGRGRLAAAEILVVMPAVAQLIRDGQTFKIPGVMTTGRRHGMQLMDNALLNLVRAGDADPEEAYRLARDKRDFLPYRRTDEPAEDEAVSTASAAAPRES